MDNKVQQDLKKPFFIEFMKGWACLNRQSKECPNIDIWSQKEISFTHQPKIKHVKDEEPKGVKA